ncbi:MAG: polysaccharide deacetylase family protein [Thermodesulfobacteriota bacterium]
MNPLPVLMYHHVNPNKGDMITVTPEVFSSHLEFIKDAGYKTLSLDELRGYIDGEYDPGGKAVVITFDDGYLDNFYYAFPLIKAYGVKAALFIATAWVDKASGEGADKAALQEEYKKAAPTHAASKAIIEEGAFSRVIMDWDMVKEMALSGLVEFGSHTVTHAGCDNISKEEVQAELRDSKKRIETELERPCRYLCWPRGRFNGGSVAAAKGLGYRGVFTTERGVVKKGSDPFAIKRIAVKDGARWFQKRVRIYTNPLMADFYLKIKGRVL